MYQNEAPMAGVTIENRMRVESNYTARSGDNCFRESSHDDKESMSSGGIINKKFQSNRMKNRDNALRSRKSSKAGGKQSHLSTI